MSDHERSRLLKQALELYRMAHFYGKEAAAIKVNELEKRLGKSLLL